MNTAFLEEAQKTPSTKLPSKIIDNFSQKGYDEIKDARLHLDNTSTRATNSIAYTYGNDIFVQNSYANNEDVLSHEAGHVIQQMRVGVSPSSSSNIINADEALENQANDIAFGDLELNSGAASGKAVQRLMSLDEFKSKTSRFMAKRNEIKTIDRQLEAYNNLIDGIENLAQNIIDNPMPFFSSILAGITSLYEACKAYKGKRNISELQAQVSQEKAAAERVIEIIQYSNNMVSEKAYKSNSQKSAAEQTKVIRSRFFTANCIEQVFNKYSNVDFCKKLTSAFSVYSMNNQVANSIDIESHTNFYLDLFRNTLNDDNAPDALKNVLAETLEFAPNVDIIEAGKFANKYKPETKGHKQYDINFSTSSENSIISSGSYLHELTHVNVGESYGNTSLFLGLSADDDYNSVFNERVEAIRNLISIIQKEITLTESSERTDFTTQHLNSDLLSKISYGVSGDNDAKIEENVVDKLSSVYISGAKRRFYDNTAEKEGISQETADDLTSKLSNILTDFKKSKQQNNVKDLFAINSTIFVEYDAVINQMLMWCYGWGIPKNNPVVIALSQMVQKEVDRRKAARQKRGINLKNLNK